MQVLDYVDVVEGRFYLIPSSLCSLLVYGVGAATLPSAMASTGTSSATTGPIGMVVLRDGPEGPELWLSGDACLLGDAYGSSL